MLRYYRYVAMQYKIRGAVPVKEESFPIFPVDESTAFTVRHHNRRYVVFHIQRGGNDLHPLVLAESGSYESRHAAVAAAQQQAQRYRSR